METHLVGRRVSWFVQIDKAMADIVLDRSIERCASTFQRRIMSCTNYHLVVVLTRFFFGCEGICLKHTSYPIPLAIKAIGTHRAVGCWIEALLRNRHPICKNCS